MKKFLFSMNFFINIIISYIIKCFHRQNYIIINTVKAKTNCESFSLSTT